MKERKFTYQKLILDKELREEFFAYLDRLIQMAVKAGFTEAARIHALNRKRIRDELELFD
ncbi:hypothetical protein [Ensifer aridi]|uniref:hypothetical protein n=1 Tax=Ensifer aridi TaxID=1708715 RepID=UPI00358F4A36